jgi:hypothetical protein
MCHSHVSLLFVAMLFFSLEKIVQAVNTSFTQGRDEQPICPTPIHPCITRAAGTQGVNQYNIIICHIHTPITPTPTLEGSSNIYIYRQYIFLKIFMTHCHLKGR